MANTAALQTAPCQGMGLGMAIPSVHELQRYQRDSTLVRRMVCPLQLSSPALLLLVS